MKYVQAAPARPENWRIKGNTAQVLIDPDSGLVQHCEARGAGVEVTWILPQPVKAGLGLVVEAEINGVEFLRKSRDGLEFTSSDHMVALTLGPVLAVDSRGRQWPVPVEIAGSRLRLAVPADVLAQAEYPLAIDPLITPQFEFDQAVPGPSPCTRGAPAVAANDAGYLIVWTHGAGDTTTPGIYAARVDPSGTLLDPYGILVSSSAAEQSISAVAALPGSFLVVWSGPHGTSNTDWDIFAARVQVDGSICDTPALPVCAASGVQCSPAVASSGTNYLVVWRDNRQTGIYGNMVTAEGKLSATNGFPICVAANDQFTPAVAALAGNYLVAWQDYRNATTTRFYSDIYGARVAGDGHLIDTNAIAITTQTNSQYYPAVAANGTNYMVVWEDYDAGGNDLLGARVSAGGEVLDLVPIVISHATNAQAYPAITSIHDASFIAWQDYRDSPTNNYQARIYGTRLAADGLVSAPDGFALSTAGGLQWYPSVAARDDELLAVWQEGRNNPATTLADIYGARVSYGSTPMVHPELALSGAANAELLPAVAANGTNYLVAWADNRNALTSGRDIYATRLNQDGTLSDPLPLAICTETNHQSDPAIAANGTDYFVVWSDWRNTPANAVHADIYGALVSPGAQVTPSNGLPVCTATNDQSLPAVAAQGTNFIVAWQDARNSTATTLRLDIYGARVSGSGQVLDSNSFVVATNVGNQTSPAIAANNQQALIVWTDFRANSVASDIYAARVQPDGTVLDTNGIALCTAALSQSAPSVATDGVGFFAAWSDGRNGNPGGTDIYGITIGMDGIPSPTNGFPIRLTPGPQSAPAVAFNGADYVVVWQESASGLSNTFDLFGSGVSPAEGPWAGSPLPINAGAYNQISPASAVGGDGRFLIVNQTFQYSAPRVVANILDLESLPRLAFAPAAGGQLQLELRGAVGKKYALEASADLQAWNQLGSFTLTNTLTQIGETPDSNITSRFYRAVLLP